MLLWGFPVGSHSEESACKYRTPGFNPWIGKIPEKGMECDVQNQWKVYSQEKQTVGVKTDLPWEGTAVFCHILQTLS